MKTPLYAALAVKGGIRYDILHMTFGVHKKILKNMCQIVIHI